MMLKHIDDMLDKGAVVENMTVSQGLKEILEDADGCSVQYRCANSLYMMHKLANELNIIYDRAIDCEGHGKKLIDGFTGADKTFLKKEFCNNSDYQPEAVDENKKSVLLYQMENGRR
jgi:hypothetical protein